MQQFNTLDHLVATDHAKFRQAHQEMLRAGQWQMQRMQTQYSRPFLTMGEWPFRAWHVTSETAARKLRVQKRLDRCAHMLQLYEDLLRSVSPQSSKELKIAMPFCGVLLEAELFVQLFQRWLDSREDITSISVFLSDIDEGFLETSRQLAVGACEFLGCENISIDARRCDLVHEEMPRSDLLLGVHPGETNFITGVCILSTDWQKILCNCSRSASLAVFATISMEGAQKIRNCFDSSIVEVCFGVPYGPPLCIIDHVNRKIRDDFFSVPHGYSYIVITQSHGGNPDDASTCSSADQERWCVRLTD
eukprot:TRINITY_DN76837_c0_g1_i1.p1 TRINITY_DN76837_c0_g1~~TRINITY_DN76837_c0_g1_i1.p1  ORF type:complete len:305 (-),score=32.09 TRINITY_DN76837_c0_g1_i1:379-1293(-)